MGKYRSERKLPPTFERVKSAGFSAGIHGIYLDQAGFTLVELVVAVSITAMVVSIMASGVTQSFRAVLFQRTGLTAMDETRRIIPVVTEDLRVATQTTLEDGADPVSTVEITSTDPDPVATHTTDYVLSGTNLVRIRDQGTVDEASWTVGRYVSAVEFSVSGSLFTVTLPVTDEGNTESVVTSTWNVYQRSSP